MDYFTLPFLLFGFSLNNATILTFTPVILGLIGSHKLSVSAQLILLCVSVVLAIIFNILNPVGLISILLLLSLCFGFKYSPNTKYKVASASLLFIVSVLMLLHMVPGFHNPLILDQFQVSANALPYSKYLNLDKAILGMLLLCFVVPKAQRFNAKQLVAVTLVFLAASVIGISIGILSGLIALEPKLTSIIFGWAVTNLLFTCLVEEAFFRGFIQQQMYNISANKHWQSAVVLVSGIIFGLAHIPAGIIYASIATIVGSAYAYSYHKTNNIYVPITVHFIFNLVHFTLFTYPYIG